MNILVYIPDSEEVEETYTVVHVWSSGLGIQDPFLSHVAVNAAVGRSPSLHLNCSIVSSNVEL